MNDFERDSKLKCDENPDHFITLYLYLTLPSLEASSSTIPSVNQVYGATTKATVHDSSKAAASTGLDCKVGNWERAV